MSSNHAIAASPTTNAADEEGQKDQVLTATAVELISFGTPILLQEPDTHYQDNVGEDESFPYTANRADHPHPAGSNSEPTIKVEENTEFERNSPNRNAGFSDAENGWNWLLNVEENYRETIANATMEVQNRLFLENTASEDEEEEDEKHYKYYYRGPEPEEPTPARKASSEAWFSACYTDHRDSYLSSELEDSDGDDCLYEADNEGETGDEETTSPGVICEGCRGDVCECTKSLLEELGTASLGETDEDVHPNA